jgi:DNA-binding transcriptional ArsR family regulator
MQSKKAFAAEAKIFKILMHPARLAILNALRAEEACVCHLEAHLGFRQAYLSQQIKLMRSAGVIQDRRDGWNVYYRVTRPEIFALIDSASAWAGPDGTNNVPRKTPPKKKCPCPKCNPNESKGA